LKFLLDVHIGLRIAQALTDAGHDVLRAALVCPTDSDAEHIERARAEDRILISEDSDFSDLIFAMGHEAPPALIYIRCDPFEQEAIIKALLEVIEDDRLAGHVAVVTTNQVRFRRFPGHDRRADPWETAQG
jgi:predicted nuclease of predicted toxin-antitoxin system